MTKAHSHTPSPLLLLPLLLTLITGCTSLPPPPHLTIPKTTTLPTIDADLSDWPPATTVSQLSPFLRVDAQTDIDRFPTTIQLAWHPDALLIAFTCSDPAPFILPRQGATETSLHKGDLVEVFLDPVGDARAWLELQVNPIGQTFDQLSIFHGPLRFEGHGRLSRDVTPRLISLTDAYTIIGLQTAARRTSTGWIVELAIPATAIPAKRGQSQLQAGQTLRANLVRYKWLPTATDQRRLLGMLWSPTQHGCPHISPTRLGHFHLVD